MTLVAKSDHSTGNSKYASYVLRSGDLTFTFTAPYSRKCAADAANSDEPLPDYDQQQAMDFVCTHGMAVRSVGAAQGSIMVVLCLVGLVGCRGCMTLVCCVPSQLRVRAEGAAVVVLCAYGMAVRSVGEVGDGVQVLHDAGVLVCWCAMAAGLVLRGLPFRVQGL